MEISSTREDFRTKVDRRETGERGIVD